MIGELELDPDMAENLLQAALCALVLYLMWCIARYFWITRRRPVRHEEPWVKPAPRRTHYDD